MTPIEIAAEQIAWWHRSGWRPMDCYRALRPGSQMKRVGWQAVFGALMAEIGRMGS